MLEARSVNLQRSQAVAGFMAQNQPTPNGIWGGIVAQMPQSKGYFDGVMDRAGELADQRTRNQRQLKVRGGKGYGINQSTDTTTTTVTGGNNDAEQFASQLDSLLV